MPSADPEPTVTTHYNEPESPWDRGLRRISALFGMPISPMLDWPFSEARINNYFAAKSSTMTGYVDDQTWKDLGLAAYRDRLATPASTTTIAAGTSIFGQQALHLRLRAVQTPDARQSSIARIKNLIADAPIRVALAALYVPLRAQDSEVSELLFTRDAPSIPTWIPYSILLPLSFVASALTFVFTPYSLFASMWFIATTLCIIVMQQQMSDPLDFWNREAKSLRQMLTTFTAIGRPLNPVLSVDLSAFADVADYAAQVNRRITRTPIAGAMPLVGDYFDWFLFTNVRHYAKCQTVIVEERAFLQACFDMVENLEADLAIARHLENCKNAEEPIFCWASEVSTPSFAFTNLVHPLLEKAAPLSIELSDKSAVLTGQNGIGKSTLMKAIGLSLITHRAFGFCYADAATASTLPVYVSLNNEDSLANSESLYIAELRRARELLALADGLQGCVCLIDEIFRGTNHLESVAAAGAVLNRLGKNATVIVSTHHAVLAPLLANSFTSFYLRMQNDDIQTLSLQPGVLSEPNGIALLGTNGFDASLQADAHAVLNWISQYLAHPTEEPNILN